MYAIKCQGDYQDPERGMITKTWPATDEDGHTLTFATRREAQAALDEMNSPERRTYDGVPNWNILSHAQYSGCAPVVCRVDHKPQWLRDW